MLASGRRTVDSTTDGGHARPATTGDPLLDGMATLGTELPFNRHLGVTILELAPGRAVTRLADDARLHNHLGGVHAIAELAPVELAGALAATGRLRAVLERGHVPVVAGLGVRYLAPAQGELRATASLGEDAVAPALTALDAGQRVRVDVDVEVTDGGGTLVATAQLTFAFLDAREAAATRAGA
jgi:acyl-coenzyme A thioesterase PaaI-like protein